MNMETLTDISLFLILVLIIFSLLLVLVYASPTRTDRKKWFDEKTNRLSRWNSPRYKIKKQRYFLIMFNSGKYLRGVMTLITDGEYPNCYFICKQIASSEYSTGKLTDIMIYNILELSKEDFASWKKDINLIVIDNQQESKPNLALVT